MTCLGTLRSDQRVPKKDVFNDAQGVVWLAEYWLNVCVTWVASGGRYDLRVVQSGAKASRINVAVALDGEKALGSSVLS
eukprot:symbB.v1.2.000757.t1/scaffold25.1/size427608/2